MNDRLPVELFPNQPHNARISSEAFPYHGNAVCVLHRCDSKAHGERALVASAFLRDQSDDVHSGVSPNGNDAGLERPLKEISAALQATRSRESKQIGRTARVARYRASRRRAQAARGELSDSRSSASADARWPKMGLAEASMIARHGHIRPAISDYPHAPGVAGAPTQRRSGGQQAIGNYQVSGQKLFNPSASSPK